jgi:2'-5' RNA ligase
MRLFVAVETGPDVARGAAAILDTLRRRVHQSAPGARLTWASPERAHITIRFIGQADGQRTGAIVSALERPLDVGPFDLEISGLGAFPAHGRPRVIWAGVTAGRDHVLEVERQISSRLDAILGPGETRGYSPHITLARVRDAAGLTRRVCDGLDASALGTAHVEAVTLFESRLSSSGSTYIPLVHTGLKPAQSKG